MEIKKLLLTGATVTAMAMMAACSEDSKGATEPEEISADSSATVPGSSGDVPPGSSGAVPPGSSGAAPTSSNGGSSLISSSSVANTDPPVMGCSEIMYNAPDGSALEWVEIYIAGGMDMDNMQNFLLHLSGAVDYTFPAEPLKKGEYVVVTNDVNLFKTTYPDFNGRVFGPWDNGVAAKLVNEGDVVNVKVDGEGDVSCAFGSEPPWPSLADGHGYTLVYKGGNPAQPLSWGASKDSLGHPGVGGDTWKEPSKVRINEVMPNAAGANAWIELYNAGDTDADMTGWKLQVKRRNQMLSITSGVVPAKGYLVLDAVANFDQELVVSSQGGEFYLYGPNHGEESSIWLPAYEGPSGLVDLKDGSTAQGPLASATPGAANAALKLGSVYINEIYYHPGANTGDIPFEFMEIVNATDQDISLYSSTPGLTKGWKVEGINLEFSSSAVIKAGALMLLIPEALEPADMQALGLDSWGPDVVRSAYSIPATVDIVTYKGKLSNRSETIAVKEPFAKEGDGVSAKYFYIWHDATLYSDAWAGLTEADGAGFSLQRVDKATMGYEAGAWKAAAPTMGKL